MTYNGERAGGVETIAGHPGLDDQIRAIPEGQGEGRVLREPDHTDSQSGDGAPPDHSRPRVLQARVVSGGLVVTGL